MASPETEFANHRTVVPMLWAFFGLAVLEFCAVHLLVTLKWPSVGWPLTIVSGASIIWLVGWIRSWPRLPHRLEGSNLVLNLGSLRSVSVPLDRIVDWGPASSLEEIRQSGTRRFTVLAAPNRFVKVDSDVRGIGKARAIAFNVDDPSRFDAAMKAALAQEH